MAATSDMAAVLIGCLFGVSLGIALTILSLMWRDGRPQHHADALEDAAIQRFKHHSVWV